MRERFCKICRGWHSLDAPWPMACRKPSANPCHVQIMNDELAEPLQSMVDGQYYSTKTALRRTYRASGNAEGKAYTEVGNEMQKPFERKYSQARDIEPAVERALSQTGFGA